MTSSFIVSESQVSTLTGGSFDADIEDAQVYAEEGTYQSENGYGRGSDYKTGNGISKCIFGYLSSAFIGSGTHILETSKKQHGKRNKTDYTESPRKNRGNDSV